MAEFQEVVRQYNRLCKEMDCMSNCPIRTEYDAYGSCWAEGMFDPERFEQIVMQWAAAHPEPVYPTWYDYVWSQLAKREPISDHDLATWMSEHRISVEIAERLELEPINGGGTQ